MEKLTRFNPIIGDDLPYVSQTFRRVPAKYGFNALTYPSDRPLTYALKDALNDFATSYYRNHEIIGETYEDFQANLQSDLLLNIDTFEKMMEVYRDDIAKPLQSRTIKRTYDITDAGTGKGKSSGTSKIDSDITNTDYDLPIDNPTGQAVQKSTSEGTTNNTDSASSESESTQKKTGTETEEWSDVGVAPNYELLNGFLDNNRSYYQVFISFFENCFTLHEAWYI